MWRIKNYVPHNFWNSVPHKKNAAWNYTFFVAYIDASQKYMFLWRILICATEIHISVAHIAIYATEIHIYVAYIANMRHIILYIFSNFRTLESIPFFELLGFLFF
jgi:hypothetical protein